MSDYDFRPGGSLKIRGGVAEGGITKKYAFALAARLSFAELVLQEEKVEIKRRQGQEERRREGGFSCSHIIS